MDSSYKCVTPTRFSIEFGWTESYFPLTTSSLFTITRLLNPLVVSAIDLIFEDTGA